MRVYEVELKRVSYVIVTVEAESSDDAQTKAFAEAAREYRSDASWEVESIEDITGQGHEGG